MDPTISLVHCTNQVKVSRVHWGVEEISQNIVVALSSDGKIRVYDTEAEQKRPVFELPVCYKRARSGAHTGSETAEKRPVNASVLADKTLITGDNVGNVDMYLLHFFKLVDDA